MSSTSRRFGFHFNVCLLAGGMIAATAIPATATDRETSLRKAVAWQVALDASGFSPGLIDGKTGQKPRRPRREFQKTNGLPVTGQLDQATADALQVKPDDVFVRYTIQKRDLDEVGPCPKSWIAKSKLDYLGHEALENVLAENFHCSTGLLNTLNPRKAINSLNAGDTLIVPQVLKPAVTPKATRLEINFFGEKTIRVIGPKGTPVALFHCSIAKDKAKLPPHDAEVTVIVPNPDYTFHPSMYPEVKEGIDHDLRIPPGPRNPVGRCWIRLSLPGYGMHGTPNPELIGKTGSHGCFRLTNWDAIRLSKMVQVGTPVKFTGQPQPEAQLASKAARLASRHH